MKKFIKTVVFTTLLLALLGGFFYLGYAYAVELVGPNGGVSWDPPTTNVDGSPLTDLGGYTIVITSDETGITPDNPSNILNSIDVNDPLAIEAPLIDLLGPLGGGVYKVWICAFDFNGNHGPFSTSVSVEMDIDSPSAPTNLKIWFGMRVHNQLNRLQLIPVAEVNR